MKYRIISLSYFFLTLVCIASSGLGQEQFVQFTFYDQLCWSTDGARLAFRCILLDEARPEELKANILLKDLTNDRLVCLNPQPERFVISADKKYLLFSSAYGLYLISLGNENRTAQIYFRNPAANWWFHDFGFFHDKRTIYIYRSDMNSTDTARENYRFTLPKFADKSITGSRIEKIKKKIRSPIFNLPGDEMRGDPLTEIKVKNGFLKFVPHDESGEYQLIHQSSRQPSSPTTLIRRCRPRLLSASPDSNEIIVSVLEEKGHHTYRFLPSSKQLIHIEASRYFSISWLDASRYICISDNGLFLRSTDLRINTRLDKWALPDWCRTIDLDFPKYEIQVGFEAEKDRADKMASQLRESGYPVRVKYFKDSSSNGYRVRVSGFKTRQEAQVIGGQLRSKGYEFWIDAITDHYDYFNSIRPDEQKSFQDKYALIQYQSDHFLRSRILLIEPNNKKHVLVDEMNNIPNRPSWKQ